MEPVIRSKFLLGHVSATQVDVFEVIRVGQSWSSNGTES